MTIPITCDFIDHQILLLILREGYVINENGNARNVIRVVRIYWRNVVSDSTGVTQRKRKLSYKYMVYCALYEKS